MYRIRFATALRIAPSVWLLARSRFVVSDYFFFNDTATTEIYTLSYTTLFRSRCDRRPDPRAARIRPLQRLLRHVVLSRSEEHTSELQSRQYLVCRLLLEKKKFDRTRGGFGGDQHLDGAHLHEKRQHSTTHAHE